MKKGKEIMQGEAPDTRLARLEEAMVSVKGDTRHMRSTLDRLAESHWHFSGKVWGAATAMSVISSLLTTVAVRLLMKG